MKKNSTASVNKLIILSLSILAVLMTSISLKKNIYAAENITISEFNIPTNESLPSDITAGADGNIWFTEFNTDKIGRITPTGEITEFSLPGSEEDDFQRGPWKITAGPDGNIWFTELSVSKIGRISPVGIFTEFQLPSTSSDPSDIVTGPDGNIWFTEHSISGNIGKITPSGIITEYMLPTSRGAFISITSGPDGNIWVTDGGVKIGKFNPESPLETYVEFTVPGEHIGTWGITTGPDGNIWFTENDASKIGRISPTGTLTEFSVPFDTFDTSNNPIVDITKGTDGNLWFTEHGKNSIGRITPDGVITELPLNRNDKFNSDNPYSITPGADGNMWFTEYTGNKIGRVNLSKPHGPERDYSLLSPFNNGVTWKVFNGYLDNRDQTQEGCGVSSNALDHCRNQLFGLDIIPDQQSDTQVLAPVDGSIGYVGELEGGCVGMRILLDNGLNLNMCHFATLNIKNGERVKRGKVLGTRNTTHVHLSLDDRYRIGTLCPGKERCFLPVPFNGNHTIEGISFDPDPNGETVLLPYSLCENKKVNCEFTVGFQQFKGWTGKSTNVAIPE